MPGPLVIIGALGSLAAIASLIAPKRRTTTGPLRTWSGTAGALQIAVTRNGPGWAWYVEWNDTANDSGGIAQGSAATAKLALQNAFRSAIESGRVSEFETLTVRSNTGDVVGQVAHIAAENAWAFEVVPPTGAAVEVHDIATRGTAALQLLDTIEPFTDGSA
jgi:hypothetical protein